MCLFFKKYGYNSLEITMQSILRKRYLNEQILAKLRKYSASRKELHS